MMIPVVTLALCRYMSNFPEPSSSQVLFEKSATYFTHSAAPERMHSLLPKAKLIVILADPIKRAYSWYHVSTYPCTSNRTFMCSLGSLKAALVKQQKVKKTKIVSLTVGCSQRT